LWGMIDADEYAHYDSPLNGDLHEVVPGNSSHSTARMIWVTKITSITRADSVASRALAIRAAAARETAVRGPVCIRAAAGLP
jgi:hypothetical protein